MVWATAKCFLFMEPSVNEHLLSDVLWDDMVGVRSEPSIRPCPVNDEHPATRFENAFDFSNHRLFYLALEKRVGKDDRINGGVLELRTSWFLDIAPDRINVGKTSVLCLVPDMLQHILLHVYRIDSPTLPCDVCSSKRVVTRARPKVGNLHSLTKPHLEDVGSWVSEVHTYKIARAPEEARAINSVELERDH